MQVHTCLEVKGIEASYQLSLYLHLCEGNSNDFVPVRVVVITLSVGHGV
jgi:hypothetical protein